MMEFWNTDEVHWGEVQSQQPRRNSREVFGVNRRLIRAQGRTPGQKDWGCEGWLTMYSGVGGGKEKGGFKRISGY